MTWISDAPNQLFEDLEYHPTRVVQIEAKWISDRLHTKSKSKALRSIMLRLEEDTSASSKRTTSFPLQRKKGGVSSSNQFTSTTVLALLHHHHRSRWHGRERHHYPPRMKVSFERHLNFHALGIRKCCSRFNTLRRGSGGIKGLSLEPSRTTSTRRVE